MTSWCWFDYIRGIRELSSGGTYDASPPTVLPDPETDDYLKRFPPAFGLLPHERVMTP